MCCLFGFHDYGHKLTRKQRSILLSVLSVASEDRGTDATGIAYNAGGRLQVYKRPLPAHLMWYRVPLDAAVVMGYTRMTTQGAESRNYNNHPFPGHTDTTDINRHFVGIEKEKRYFDIAKARIKSISLKSK